MTKLPCFITSFNHLSWVRQMIPDVRRIGFEPCVVDHGSTYPPLLEWYERGCDCQVVLTGHNAGCHGFFRSELCKLQTGFFAHTDGDLDMSGVPDDAAERLVQAFRANPWATKAALSLEIEDLPEASPFTARLKDIEGGYWTRPTADGHWNAITDTTFALYHGTERPPGEPLAPGMPFYQAVRLNRPYTARHLPFYLDLNRPTEEDRYFYAHIDGSSSFSGWVSNHLAGRGKL